MAIEPILITREALYEQVWAEPMSKIASRFNLSDRGLAKLCARFDIPVPPRGWWAKKQHGQKVKQPPLPVTGRVKPITIHKWWAPPTVPKPEETPPEIAFEQDPANRIVVPERTARLHPLVSRTKEALNSAKPLHYDRPLLFPPVGCLSVQVTRGHVTRALRIMDALVRAFEQRGYAPSVPAKASGLSVNVLNVPFLVSLDEKTKQVKREMTESERRDAAQGWRKSNPYDLAPTGELCLSFRDQYRMRYQVTDTGTRVLEDRLNDFIVKMLKEALAEQYRRQQREKEQFAREEAERLRREEAAREAKEQEKIDQWDQWMTAWKRTQDIRAFASAIREALAPIEEGSKPAEWLVWAEGYARRIDPLASKADEPEVSET